MATIRRKFNLGDRLALPAFNSRERDISLWPLLKDEPPMRDNPRTPRTRRNGFFTSKEERERKEREKTKVERGLDTARTTQATAAVGILAAKRLAPQAAATVGAAVAGKVGAGVAGRAVPLLGEVLMVAGAGKEAYKVVKRRKKEGWKSGSWKTDLAKVGAGAVGLEDFVPDAPKKNPRRRNPLTFDNRVEVTPQLRDAIRARKDRVVASVLAPTKHRAIEEATANSPHNFRIVLVHENDWDGPEEYVHEDAVTLRFRLGAYYLAPLMREPEQKARPKSETFGIFTAFTYLHRFGDNILQYLFDALMGPRLRLDDFFAIVRGFQLSDPDRLPKEDRNRLIEAFERLRPCHVAFMQNTEREYFLSTYIKTHINSKMVRENYSASIDQSLADLFPLCELTPASRPLFLPFDAARMGIDRHFVPSEVKACNAYGEQMNVLFREFYNALIPALYGSVWDI
jgi:hypothetical protein